MIITRRHFLKSSLASATLVSFNSAAPNLLLRAAAQSNPSEGDRVLVVLQLSGGNDGLNTVVPFSHDLYQANRFTLRLGAERVLKIDDTLAFHPALAGFARLLEQGRLAVVQGVGYPDPDRSHFSSMDIWHTARRELTTRSTGWIGRYLDRTASPEQPGWHALHVGRERQPIALAGARASAPTLASSDELRLEDAGQPGFRTTLPELVGTDRARAPGLLGFLEQHARQAVLASEQISQALQHERSPVDYPASDLAQRLRLVAQLIDAGLGTRIYYLTLSGFDTHADQDGAHAALLREMGDGVSAFLDDLAHRGQAGRVALVAFSEFGRRLRENASRGTDHGAAAPMFVAGGAVKAGVIGAHPSLDDLDQGDLRFHTDFRQVYAGALERWLGVDSAAVLGQKFEPVWA